MFSRLIVCAGLFALSVTATAKLIQQQNLSWPREIEGQNANVTLFQPQLNSMDNNVISFDMAFSAKPKGATKEQKPSFGAINGQCTLEVNETERLAYCKNFQINKVSFPVKPDKEQAIQEALNSRVANKSLEMSYDRLQAALSTANIKKREHKTDFNFQPPKIFVANEPTALISIDGEPALRKVKDSSMMRVINTPFVILFDSKQSEYYLRSGASWHVTNDLMDDWRVAKDVPKDVRAFEKTLKNDSKNGKDINKFIFTTTPAALIQINGEPEYTPIPGTDLLYVNNTDSKLFLQTKTERYYVLISGRWYSSDELISDAEWVYVPNRSLPGSFAQIPQDSPMADVLASVSGTVAAEEAIIRNNIPVTNTFDKKSLSLEVSYDGEPQFKAIDGTKLEYAVNADKPVIRYQNQYFANDQAVWFMAKGATGPWQVANEVPDEIYQIPPQSPLYNLTYSYVYNADADSITVGFTPGYRGSYDSDGAVIYGTGYEYDSWVGDEYYGAPQTYGYEYQYDPYYGWYSPAPFLWWGGAAAGWWAGSTIWHHNRWEDRKDWWNDRWENRPNRPDRPGRPGKPDRPGAGHPDRPGVGPGRPRPEQPIAGRPGRPDRPGVGPGRPRPEQPIAGRPGRPDRPSVGQPGRPQTRPGRVPSQPSVGVPSQPQLPQQPQLGQRPGDLTRPGTGARPTPGTRPGQPRPTTRPAPGQAKPFQAQRRDNVYAGGGGNVYRKQGSNTWQKQTNRGWQQERNRATTQQLNRQAQARNRGNQLAQRPTTRPRPQQRPSYHRPSSRPQARPRPSGRPASRPAPRGGRGGRGR